MKQPKTKNCIHCGKAFSQFNSLVKVCCTDCAIAYSKIKVEQKAIKDVLSYENLKSIDVYQKKLKASQINTKMQVHAYIRKRDINKNCISCNTQYNDTFQAGHFYSANSFISLRYNLDNIHGQCKRCNLFLEGNFDNYALNLPNRIGKERYNALVQLAGIDKQLDKVWDLDNLKEIRLNLKDESNK